MIYVIYLKSLTLCLSEGCVVRGLLHTEAKRKSKEKKRKKREATIAKTKTIHEFFK